MRCLFGNFKIIAMLTLLASSIFPSPAQTAENKDSKADYSAAQHGEIIQNERENNETIDDHKRNLNNIRIERRGDRQRHIRNSVASPQSKER